ncbi:hypothetical protein E2L08_12230 [Palleronia sediminis]|uniref:Uncharacterized protein n=1 Tax=Palleronia sediminis TaxID=2547833 RepID=A0A4R6A5P6_9RHOB|nr:hypothetical protein [Palleronia sediminis]TDL78062.1 hypothetical protein E2L08_12230 [Palleronia sediminis]
MFDSLDAETLARLQRPDRPPPGVAFQPLDMQGALGRADAFRLTASLGLADDARSDAAAEWLWSRLAPAAPLVVTVDGTRARLGEAAALAWLIDKARG